VVLGEGVEEGMIGDGFIALDLQGTNAEGAGGGEGVVAYLDGGIVGVIADGQVAGFEGVCLVGLAEIEGETFLVFVDDFEVDFGGVYQLVTVIVHLGIELENFVFGEGMFGIDLELAFGVMDDEILNCLGDDFVEGFVVLIEHVIVQTPLPQAFSGKDAEFVFAVLFEVQHRVIGLDTAYLLLEHGVGIGHDFVGTKGRNQGREFIEILEGLIIQSEEGKVLDKGGEDIIGFAFAVEDHQAKIEVVEQAYRRLRTEDIPGRDMAVFNQGKEVIGRVGIGRQLMKDNHVVGVEIAIEFINHDGLYFVVITALDALFDGS